MCDPRWYLCPGPITGDRLAVTEKPKLGHELPVHFRRTLGFLRYDCILAASLTRCAVRLNGPFRSRSQRAVRGVVRFSEDALLRKPRPCSASLGPGRPVEDKS